ncbi:phosphoglucosamine mutase [Fretibacterium sp. OH1220_COT-178]|uniref:phosphoglucosamine mutase n=1 Tax=Fretibacterium sp. OH1220_COT-178 TaxID=2491047 RepID=UPI000F5EBC8F|nr:phosphoglucosamine mutase [Fretibacterium sp. OH1220_COT-178]RRD64863.1 phosphoglucosamine mutase [Fretibacterium sp. OH1220_COT-178]
MRNKRVLFGTDGVRDVANRGGMTPEMALRLGRAFILFLAERGVPRPRIVLGRDTRRSGMMLEGALSAGMTSAGAEVLSVGIIPTPGVSYAVQHLAADAGAVISASHNPAEYNGIKFLDRDGCKLSDESELSIEEYLGDNLTDDWRPTGASIGEIRQMPHLVHSYAEHLASLLSYKDNLPSRVVFDCAHGAAGAVMPALLERLGVKWSLIGADPDGLNINEGVGVIHMRHLGNYVNEFCCDLGFAFDGDADRVLMVDSKGRPIDGDIAIWVLARWLSAREMLGNGVVVTVMSNMALEEHLNNEQIPVFRCPVGDRYVLETMRRRQARLGGEQSGHIIADAFTRTGDGLCTALVLLNALRELDEDVDTLVDRFGRYPQKLSNLVLSPKCVLDMERVDAIAEEAQQGIRGRGRVLVRPSGTEPLLRILVEAKEEPLVDEISAQLMEQLKAYC